MLPFDLGEVHLDRLAREAHPAVAAGVVGNLLVGEAGHDGGEQIEVAWFADPGSGEAFLADRVELSCDGVGLLGRLEAGDGALEEQLVADGVGRRKPGELLDQIDERLVGSSWSGSAETASISWRLPSANMAS